MCIRKSVREKQKPYIVDVQGTDVCKSARRVRLSLYVSEVVPKKKTIYKSILKKDEQFTLSFQANTNHTRARDSSPRTGW